MSDPGIDYSNGTANFDTNTGIHFGVIPVNRLVHWAWDEFEADYGDPTCGHCGNELVEYDDEKHGGYPETRDCCDFACESCEIIVGSDHAYGDEPNGWSYEGDGYKLYIDGSGDVWVLKSPYFIRAQYCSPCAPGAGYLLNGAEDGPKTYCLGEEWFEKGEMPYIPNKIKGD